MKKLLFPVFLLMALLPVSAQSEGNPFQRLGYTTPVYTFGEDKEFHDQDIIVEIGPVLYNTKTNKVVGFVEEKDSLVELTPELQSMSIDPHCEKYYSISPYAYCFNNPVRFIDPDGRDTYEYNMKTRELTWINDAGGNKVQNVDFMDGDDYYTSTLVNGENVFVYALKDCFAVTNFDANFDDNAYNIETGYEYSFEDFQMRRELTKDENPIGKYITGQERQGMAEPITRRDAENEYGNSLMGLITLSRAIDSALSLTDGTINHSKSVNGFKGKNVLNSNYAPQSSTNSWNRFLKANKGKYSGENWMQRARKDYYNSPYSK